MDLIKLKVFYELAKQFNILLNSNPILYGSLGLSQYFERDLGVDDIDILIESIIFSQRLDDIHRIMLQLGFKLIDKDENEFLRNNIKVGIASDGDMKSFSNIEPSCLQVVTEPVKFRVLTLNDYLSCYLASSLDGYRRVKRQKNDSQKIDIIKEKLSH